MDLAQVLEFLKPAGLVTGAGALYLWLSQKRREQRGAAAVQVYELATRGVEALHQLAAPYLLLGFDDPDKVKDALAQFRKMRAARHLASAEGRRALDEAASRAALFLDGRIEFIMRGLLAMRELLVRNYYQIEYYGRMGDVDQVRRLISETWGYSVKTQIDDIYESLKINLRPFAQYHVLPLLSTIIAAQRVRLIKWNRARRLKRLPREQPVETDAVVERNAKGDIQNVHTFDLKQEKLGVREVE